MEINKIISDKTRDDLYLIEFPDLVLVIAPVSFQRAKAYKVLATSNPEILTKIEDAFFKECKVDSEPPITSDEQYDQLKAGISSTVFKLGLGVSLPPQEKTALDEQFAAAQSATKNSTETQLILLICRAFGYKPEELESWTWEKIVRRATEAQFLLNPQSEPDQYQHTIARNKKITR